jgi:hypothetical protein
VTNSAAEAMSWSNSVSCTNGNPVLFEQHHGAVHAHQNAHWGGCMMWKVILPGGAGERTECGLRQLKGTIQRVRNPTGISGQSLER